MSIQNTLEVIRNGVSQICPIFHWGTGKSQMLNCQFNGYYDGVCHDLRIRIWRKGNIVVDLDWKDFYKNSSDGGLILNEKMFISGTPPSVYLLAGEGTNKDENGVLYWEIQLRIYSREWGGRVYIQSGRFFERRTDEMD